MRMDNFIYSRTQVKNGCYEDDKQMGYYGAPVSGHGVGDIWTCSPGVRLFIFNFLVVLLMEPRAW